jgi:Fe2+ or Zn2+ uptake regulation protein
MSTSAEAVLEDVAHRLRSRGERMTRPRRAVLGALARSTGHLTAEEVCSAVAEADPGVHRASVYRTLEAMSQLGVVQHVHVGHGGTTYHLVAGAQAHLHVQCRSCAAVFDAPGGLLDGAAAELLRRHGFVLDPSHVALSGLCADCARARPPR